MFFYRGECFFAPGFVYQPGVGVADVVFLESAHDAIHHFVLLPGLGNPFKSFVLDAGNRHQGGISARQQIKGVGAKMIHQSLAHGAGDTLYDAAIEIANQPFVGIRYDRHYGPRLKTVTVFWVMLKAPNAFAFIAGTQIAASLYFHQSILCLWVIGFHVQYRKTVIRITENHPFYPPDKSGVLLNRSNRGFVD